MRPSKLLPIIAALAFVLVALVAAGCGGGGDDTTESAATAVEAPPAPTKAELISQGDAICGEVNKAIGALAVSETEVPDQIEQTADLYIGMVESIKRLGTPQETVGYGEFIAAAEELAAVEAEAKLASEREDTAALGEAATKAAPVLEEFESIAGEYGFEECSEGPSAPTASTPGSGVTPPLEEEGGVEVAPEEFEEEAPAEEIVPEEVAPETGGAGGGVEEAAPEVGGGTGGSSGGVGPG
jgi:hypothetical protein